MISLGTKLFAGITVALALALGGLGLLYRSEVRENATLRQANEASQKAIDRLEADQVINEAIAIADASERRKLDDDARELEGAAANANNDCQNDGLSAVIERRRLQRSGGGEPRR